MEQGHTVQGGHRQNTADCVHRDRGAHMFTSAQEAPAPTCDPVLDLPLHLEGVHIDGPVADETCTGDSPVGLAEPVLMVIISGKHTVL